MRTAHHVHERRGHLRHLKLNIPTGPGVRPGAGHAASGRSEAAGRPRAREGLPKRTFPDDTAPRYGRSWARDQSNRLPFGQTEVLAGAPALALSRYPHP